MQSTDACAVISYTPQCVNQDSVCCIMTSCAMPATFRVCPNPRFAAVTSKRSQARSQWPYSHAGTAGARRQPRAVESRATRRSDAARGCGATRRPATACTRESERSRPGAQVDAGVVLIHHGDLCGAARRRKPPGFLSGVREKARPRANPPRLQRSVPAERSGSDRSSDFLSAISPASLCRRW